MTYADARAEAMWAAGLFEGEGCVSAERNARLRGGINVRIAVKMNDRDVVERFARAVGARMHVERVSRTRPTEMYRASVSGAAAIDALTLMWDGLGERRKARSLELIGEWVEARYGADGVIGRGRLSPRAPRERSYV